MARRDVGYDQQYELEKLADSGTEYLCPACEGRGGRDVGENRNPGGTGSYDWEECTVCNTSGTITLRKITRK